MTHRRAVRVTSAVLEQLSLALAHEHSHRATTDGNRRRAGGELSALTFSGGPGPALG